MAEWVFKLSVNTARNWYRSFSSHWGRHVMRMNTPTTRPTGNNEASHCGLCVQFWERCLISPTYCLTAVMSFCVCTKAILGPCDMKVLADACWVDKTKSLTISAHLQALTQREQGHGWVRLSYRHIFICEANPELLAKLCFFLLLLFAPPCLWVSGGLFVPCGNWMQAVG